MKKIQDRVAWYTKDIQKSDGLKKDISCDVVVVGGGMAGLSAAQHFAHAGSKVVLIEKNFIGSGATGKSSGFITPDSELSLDDIAKTSGFDEAKKIWNFINSGVDFIRNNITTHSLQCDYQEKDTLILATNKKSIKDTIEAEYATRKKLQLDSTIYSAQDLLSIVSSSDYYGGISYGGTFNINAFTYCQDMKKVLQDSGIQIYENTPAISIDHNKVTTPHGQISAQSIIMCTDHHTPDLLPEMKYAIYHVQTFILISKPLSDEQMKSIFPNKQFMAWDTDMIYHYFRATADNRILVGGASLYYTFASEEVHNSEYMIKDLSNYFYTKFPHATFVEFEAIWPGLIGISKDIFPIAGFDKNIPSLYYATACAGLPFAAALGDYASQAILQNRTDLDHYFSPYRKFALGKTVQNILGTKLTIALNNFFKVNSL